MRKESFITSDVDNAQQPLRRLSTDESGYEFISPENSRTISALEFAVNAVRRVRGVADTVTSNLKCMGKRETTEVDHKELAEFLSNDSGLWTEFLKRLDDLNIVTNTAVIEVLHEFMEERKTDLQNGHRCALKEKKEKEAAERERKRKERPTVFGNVLRKCASMNELYEKNTRADSCPCREKGLSYESDSNDTKWNQFDETSSRPTPKRGLSRRHSDLRHRLRSQKSFRTAETVNTTPPSSPLHNRNNTSVEHPSTPELIDNKHGQMSRRKNVYSNDYKYNTFEDLTKEKNYNLDSPSGDSDKKERKGSFVMDMYQRSMLYTERVPSLESEMARRKNVYNYDYEDYTSKDLTKEKNHNLDSPSRDSDKRERRGSFVMDMYQRSMRYTERLSSLESEMARRNNVYTFEDLKKEKNHNLDSPSRDSDKREPKGSFVKGIYQRSMLYTERVSSLESEIYCEKIPSVEKENIASGDKILFSTPSDDIKMEDERRDNVEKHPFRFLVTRTKLQAKFDKQKREETNPNITAEWVEHKVRMANILSRWNKKSWRNT